MACCVMTKVNISNKKKNPLAHLLAPATLNVASITIANGGDNIGIYVPLFSTFSVLDLTITVTIFLMLTYCWLLIAEYLMRHSVITHKLKKITPYVFPVILIGLGIYILIECNTYQLLMTYIL
jgi:cadmium resistance protein CadD (predicted permease)